MGANGYSGDGQSNKLTPTREKLYTRWGQLKTERATWWVHWSEITTYILPRSGRYFVQDRDLGTKRHNAIYDSTGTRALRVLSAGMMAGMTSPARPWFRLALFDKELAKSQAVKVWLSDVTRLMLDIFQRSNTYRALHSMYEELGAFGTAACIILPDYNDVIRCYPLTIGEYAIATDYRGQVTTLYREFQKTVHELVTEFGIENVSPPVRSMYESGTLDKWISIIHAIEPRSDRDPSKSDSRNMAWSSCYFEVGGQPGKYLRESGFKRFPAVVPRWSTSGGDIYGNGPGMEALGDIKQLQHEQLRKAQGIDYMTKPPLQVPVGMKNRDVETLPGGITFVDMAGQGGGIKSAFEVNLNLNHLLADIQDVRERIKGSFYADLFLMLANSTNPQMTATEVAERHEEKMLMLGPVVERLQNELLDPLIDITFTYMADAGILPPPPDELQGANVIPEFVSMLAQAQRAIATNSIDRFVNSLAGVAQIKPDVLDKFDSDRWVDEYADDLGISPELVLAQDKVDAMRAQRAQQVQAAQQAQLANQQADTAQKLANAKTDQPSALTNVIDMFSGYNNPGVVQ